MHAEAQGALELWGGAECTVNRVGDAAFDQIVRTRHPGHGAALQVDFAALRIPLLWERVAPHALADADWTWCDRELALCRVHGVRPIAGLLHHGSGPLHTHLLDPGFPDAFAAYAESAAVRYPWIEHWTPINEPLTTARFSGLYGHWYPHARDNDAYLLALVQQLRASVLAMRAIRRVIPGAHFVLAEDLGKASSSPALAYQCEHENERRWLSVDLLRGADTAAVAAARTSTTSRSILHGLDWLCEHPTPPDVFGINHYVTSNRHLDDRLHLFPGVPVGGNGRDRYVDVEAVRVRGADTPDFGDLLLQAWSRTRLPLALTEVHIDGTPHDQQRWIEHAWAGALRARSAGADVRAVTAWSLFGQVDWHNLLTREEHRYQPGVFDTRVVPARPSPLLAVLQSLAGRTPRTPPSDAGGWWANEHRYAFCIQPDSPALPAAA